MAIVYTNFEQARIDNEARQIIGDLVAIGGVSWAMNTVSLIPSFADPYQENLRLRLKEKLNKLNKHLL